MLARKRSTKGSRKPKAGPVAHRLLPIFSTAVGSVLNMTAVVATSGTVLLSLLTAKRFL
jgi:hypothetical protein